jgi:hypothetical protein
VIIVTQKKRILIYNMEFRNNEYKKIYSEDFRKEYDNLSKGCLSMISDNKGLTVFDGFNKRLKLNIGMEINYNHSMSGVIKENTQDLYRYMMKITDLWFAYEHIIMCSHLQGLILKSYKRGYCDVFSNERLDALGFSDTSVLFNEILKRDIYSNKKYKQEFYRILAYIKNRLSSKSVTKKIDEITDVVKSYDNFSVANINYLIYGLRNVYVHKGVASAFGTRSTKFKLKLYSMLYEYLVCICFLFGSSYCKAVNDFGGQVKVVK